MKTIFTSESVTEGHPDKVCDRISDSILDAVLAVDENSRVACETMVKDNYVILAGEITSKASPDYDAIVRDAIDYIGYTEDCGFWSGNVSVTTHIKEQSPDIALGVDNSLETKSGLPKELGAGDQGMMFGYACTETDELMPLSTVLANNLCRKLTEIRKSGEVDFLRPDGKSQVTVEYREGKPFRVDTVVLSSQHTPDIDIERLRSELLERVIKKVIPENLLDTDTKIYVNPTGRFVVGGPVGDSGVTGRKIIVDSYGGYARHGGGCYSGKDATKVDRSAAYMARYVAKNIVAAGIAQECEVQFAYAIGVAKPVSVMVECFGTAKYENSVIEQAVREVFDLRPSAIIRDFGLLRPIFTPLSAYGHFGRTDLRLPWEMTDRADKILAAVNK